MPRAIFNSQTHRQREIIPKIRIHFIWSIVEKSHFWQPHMIQWCFTQQCSKLKVPMWPIHGIGQEFISSSFHHAHASWRPSCLMTSCHILTIIYNAFPPERLHSDFVLPPSYNHEVIPQYHSCNTGELDRHVQHQQPCLASRTIRVIVRQEQPVLSGTHWSSFAHRQMSVVLCLRRFPMKIENCHIRHQRPPKVHQRPPH